MKVKLVLLVEAAGYPSEHTISERNAEALDYSPVGVLVTQKSGKFLIPWANIRHAQVEDVRPAYVKPPKSVRSLNVVS